MVAWAAQGIDPTLPLQELILISKYSQTADVSFPKIAKE